jgi:Fe-S cluster assembly protein SufD
VVHGFFADIIRRIGVPGVEQRLIEAVEAELAVNVGLPTQPVDERPSTSSGHERAQ